MTISTPERVDLVQLIAAMLSHLETLGDREDNRVFYTFGNQNRRLDNCRKVRRKLMELLDESAKREGV